MVKPPFVMVNHYCWWPCQQGFLHLRWEDAALPAPTCGVIADITAENWLVQQPWKSILLVCWCCCVFIILLRLLIINITVILLSLYYYRYYNIIVIIVVVIIIITHHPSPITHHPSSSVARDIPTGPDRSHPMRSTQTGSPWPRTTERSRWWEGLQLLGRKKIHHIGHCCWWNPVKFH